MNLRRNKVDARVVVDVTEHRAIGRVYVHRQALAVVGRDVELRRATGIARWHHGVDECFGIRVEH